MAEKPKLNQTTSSKVLDGKNNDVPAHTPTRGGTSAPTNFDTYLSESYHIVRQRQKRYNELHAQSRAEQKQQHTQRRPAAVPKVEEAPTETADETADSGGEEEWQEVCSGKNKLKRKKQLSTSLTSMTDSVNQEKRTRIEGMQLNCRGRLNINEAALGAAAKGPSAKITPKGGRMTSPSLEEGAAKRLIKSEVASSTTTPQTAVGSSRPDTSPAPPRLKRRLEENVQTIQKLNALADQFRLEINELKSSLTTERGAVRVLRAHNESETRRLKAEIKKLHTTLETQKKNKTQAANAKKPLDHAGANLGVAATMTASGGAVMGTSALAHHELQRLTNEIAVLKEANKAMEERKMINCDADRRKAADIRELKDSYEIRLTQLTKSARTEITRLLEEIKTKDRSVGQLKNQLRALHGKAAPSPPAGSNSSNNAAGGGGAGVAANQSRNATTSPGGKTTKCPPTIKSSTNSNTPTHGQNKQLTKKSKDEMTNKPQHNETTNNSKSTMDNLSNQFPNDSATRTSSHVIHNDESAVPYPDELKELQDVELLHNTRNLQNLKASGVRNFSNFSQITHTDKVHATPKCDRMPPMGEHGLTNLLIPKTQTQQQPNTTKAHTQQKTTCEMHPRELHAMPHETKEQGARDARHDYRAKDQSSDSDSAVSSAPTSISPQPPPAGLDTADIWQMIRTYATDIDKLQKDIEVLQKENEQLHSELNLAKEQLTDQERNSQKATDNMKMNHLMERIKFLEDLQAESSELREQNELLEFRILELEETNDKWSIQSHATPPEPAKSPTNSRQSDASSTSCDVWSCGKPSGKLEDPMQMLFGTNRSSADSGITSPHNSQPAASEEDAFEGAHDDLQQRVAGMLNKTTLDEDDRQCLQRIHTLLQQINNFSPRGSGSSGPNSLNMSHSSSDEMSSLDLVKSRISDYSSGSASSASSSSASSTCQTSFKFAKSCAPPTTTSVPSAASGAIGANARIVATVQPYNSLPPSTQSSPAPSQAVIAPTNTPTESPRKSRQPWLCNNSLTESGVFVESDFFSDSSEHNASTQTDFVGEEGHDNESGFINSPYQHHQQQRSGYNADPRSFLASPTSAAAGGKYATHPIDPKHLQYYQERIDLLERKVLIYESSGDQQAKRLAERLQREIRLEKDLQELRDRVDFLKSENAAIEEEKCEFEEAENDTRLRLQKLEIELEILSQRNIELEMSREALGAKYKDCRSDCLILREDLGVCETQIRHLEEDKQKAKENLEFLHSTLPLFLIFNTLAIIQPSTAAESDNSAASKMGNVVPSAATTQPEESCSPANSLNRCAAAAAAAAAKSDVDLELQCLREEANGLRIKIKQLNARHYEALESADSHWVDIEREYKRREEAYLLKEACLKQKITRLQDCVREDSRAAHEKINQLEEMEKELKCCLIRTSKEHRELLDEHRTTSAELETFKVRYDQLVAEQQPLRTSLEEEKKRCKTLSDELNFMRRLQQEMEAQSLAEMEALRTQLNEIKKAFLHIEVTNSELKEEVTTLENQIVVLQANETELEDKVRTLTDEVRTKDELCQKLEKRLERSEGYSLADELNGSPSKRFKREDVKDLQSAHKGLSLALRNVKDCDALPSHKQFQVVARSVKKLADSLLHGDDLDEEVSTEVARQSGGKSVVEEVDVEVEAEIEIEVDMEEIDANAPEDCGTSVQATIASDSDADARDPIVTVGMALIPIFTMNDNFFPTSSTSCNKKQICEVPSELRKISKVEFPSNTTTACDASVEMSPSKTIRSRRKKWGHKILGDHKLRRIHRFASSLTTKRLQTYYDAVDLEFSHSEILTRSLSYSSFHSVSEDVGRSEAGATETNQVDQAVEAQVLKVDQEVDACAEYAESGVQVSEFVPGPTYQLESIPSHLREFLILIKTSVPLADAKSLSINAKLGKRWQADEDFQKGLAALHAFALRKFTNGAPRKSHSYEFFVNALTCLQAVVDIFKPHPITILQEIEEQINEELMNFHTHKMEREFYCTVYYPIKRQVSLL